MSQSYSISTQGLILPSGKKIPPIEGMPKELEEELSSNPQKLKRELIRLKLASESDFDAPKKSMLETISSAADSTGQFLKENLELPGGLAGAGAGAAVGFGVGGPPGALVGSIIGGAVGTGGGSLASDLVAKEDLDYAEAIEEALISAGMDLVTLGLASKVRPFITTVKAAGMSTEEASKLFLKEAQREMADKAAQDITDFASQATARAAVARTGTEGLPVGSEESLRASQELAEKAGGTLTPVQTNRAGSVRVLTQGIAEMGLGSSKIIKDNTEKVKKAAQDSLASLINRTDEDFRDTDLLGKAMFDIIDTAKIANSKIFDANLEEIGTKLGNKKTDLKSVVGTLNSFLEKNKKKDRRKGSKLNDKSRAFVEKLIEEFSGMKTIKASSLTDIQQELNEDISELLKSTVSSEATAGRQLSELSTLMREHIRVKLKGIDPEAALMFNNANKNYKEIAEGILPTLNERFIKAAEKRNYTNLGRLLTAHMGSLSEIKKMMKSIDLAYGTFKKAGNKVIKQEEDKFGIKTPKEFTLDDLKVKSAEEAKSIIKSAYLSSRFQTVAGKFDEAAYETLASEFQKPDLNAKLVAILGKDAATVKQIMNLLTEASKEVEGNLGSLLFRSKEYGAIETGLRVPGAASRATFTQGAQVVGAGAVGTGLGIMDLATAGLILTVPMVLAKISTNPKLARKLLAFEKTKFKSENQKLLAVNNLAQEAMANMTEEERREVRDSIRTVGSDETSGGKSGQVINSPTPEDNIQDILARR